MCGVGGLKANKGLVHKQLGHFQPQMLRNRKLQDRFLMLWPPTTIKSHTSLGCHLVGGIRKAIWQCAPRKAQHKFCGGGYWTKDCCVSQLFLLCTVGYRRREGGARQMPVNAINYLLVVIIPPPPLVIATPL